MAMAHAAVPKTAIHDQRDSFAPLKACRCVSGCLTGGSPLPTTIEIMKTRAIATLFFSLFCTDLVAQEKVARLYEGPAPGSENWKQEEKEKFS